MLEKNLSIVARAVLIGIIGYNAEIYAAPNMLLHCLAKEEETLFKKSSQNAVFRLNQEFVNELASSNDINLKKNYIDEICHSHNGSSPSVNLLRLLLIKEHELYDMSLSGVEASMRPFKMGYINEFQKQVPRIFVQYISGLQSELATADCLGNAIPELVGFNEKIRYLEEELPTHELITQKSKIEKIFSGLKNFETIKKECVLLKKKLSTRRMKKK